MNKNLDELQEIIGYSFLDPSLLKKALIHPSYSGEMKMQRYESNQRLEFLGDAVLELLVSDYLYNEHPTEEEGELTRKRSSLVFEAALCVSARSIRLGEFICLGKGEDSCNGREKPSILSDAFEAVLGAVYLDGGLEPARRLVDNFVIGRVDEMSLLRDGKSRIQQYVQKTQGSSLNYQVTETDNADEHRRFEAEVFINGSPVASGSGQSKKLAEQAAAMEALKKLGVK